MAMDNIKRLSKGDETQKLLLEFILDSGLKPGDRLPSEEELATRFGVSRVSIRESLHGLKFLGLLSSATRRGTTLTEIDFARLTRYLSFQLAFSSMPEKDLLEARLAIELGALELLCGQLTDATYVQLRQLAEGVTVNEGSPEELERQRQGDFDFHRLLLSSGGNVILEAFSSLLETFFRRLQSHVSSMEEINTATADHKLLVEALKDNNIDMARGIMRRHLARHCPAK